jgi:hypothetical protein
LSESTSQVSSSKKQAISKNYFKIASIQLSKELSNYIKTLCFVGAIETGDAPEKSNILSNFQKNVKSFLGMSFVTKRNSLAK